MKKAARTAVKELEDTVAQGEEGITADVREALRDLPPAPAR